MRNLFKSAVAGFLGLFAVGSQAAIVAADLTSPLAGITTDATTIFGAVLPVVIAVLGLIIGMKLVKKFVSKI